MSSVNKVILVGNLGADPDVRTTASGQMVATLSIATSERWTDGQGERKERTEWHRVIVWGKLAELAQRYLQKGRKVFVEWKIQTRSWEDQNTGEKRYSTEVVANELVFLDSGDSGGQSQDRGQSHDRGQGHDRAPAHDRAPSQDRGHGNPSQGRQAQQARPAQSSQGQRRQSSPPPSDETFDGNVPF